MALLEVKLVFADGDELQREYDRNLRHGRAFVAELLAQELLADVALVVERRSDGASVVLPARVVMKLEAGPMQGTALELDLSRSGASEALTELVTGALATESDELPSLPEAGAETGAETEAETGAETGAEAGAETGAETGAEAGAETGAETGAEAGTEPDEVVGLRGPLARLRQLGATERHKLARDGNLEERVLLERLFGKSLWEDLLRNPQISVPEVARIASKGTAPRIMLEQIADNPAWSRQSIVRRALLANPRVSTDGVAKLLRNTARNELRLIVQTAAYPATVRAAARKLIDA